MFVNQARSRSGWTGCNVLCMAMANISSQYVSIFPFRNFHSFRAVKNNLRSKNLLRQANLILNKKQQLRIH